ncbi:MULTISPECIES: Fpg/Nei family DNA glycosylase [unclassified Microbacterium]|uniref:Fpg/Nei family DNA glycosylase n=1 Tax=unclassified Microbacterium TaxID=2609290 RepID=UPI0012F9BDE8|nr:DNA-formamidopyrimidine glycosylase family protein [Microbacterium sp. MAH-37]MVQ41937.1 Fpg/Nei family DNA glycosylase [Microbacterium sp. MAH-37]
MPESPEVQALAEQLDERMAGHAIASVDAVERRIVKTRDRPPSSVVGARIDGVRRFGKYLGFDLGGQWLVLSFGRNGWIRWRPGGTPDPDAAGYAVAAVRLDDGALMEIAETGDFLAVAVWVVDAPEDVAGIADLGPDPISPDFAPADLERAMGTRRKQIKALLQEQRSVAGIGNAYSDEILHRARLSPTVHAVALTVEERVRLYQATVDIMRGAVADRRGVPADSLKRTKVAAMAVHGRAGESCPVCGDTIVDHTFGGASAQLCPTCQPSRAS